jgi:hypothetical protein
MRDWEAERGNHIKHYKIKCLDQGGFYVTTRQTFANLPELVAAYMSMPFLINAIEWKMIKCFTFDRRSQRLVSSIDCDLS